MKNGRGRWINDTEVIKMYFGTNQILMKNKNKHTHKKAHTNEIQTKNYCC